MSWTFWRKKTKKERIVEAYCKRTEALTAEKSPFHSGSYWTLGVMLFLVEIFLTYLVCFVGQSPAGPQVVPGQTARIRVVADFAFDYVSVLQTQKLERQRQQLVAPVYRIDSAPLMKFVAALRELDRGVTDLKKRLVGLNESMAATEQQIFLQTFTRQYGLKLDDIDLHRWIFTEDEKRHRMLEDGISILKTIMRDGVYRQTDEAEDNLTNTAASYFFSFDVENAPEESRVQSERNALRLLRLNLYAMENDFEATRALFHLLRLGVMPNLIYDPAKTQEKLSQVVSSTPPVIVRVGAGQTIIEPGTVVTPEQHEQLAVYRSKIKNNQTKFNIFGAQRLLFTIGLIWIGGMCIFLTPSLLKRSKRCVVMAGLVLLVNLALIRMVMQLGETNFFGRNPLWLATLTYASPLVVGPLVLTLMVDAASGILMSFMVCAFNALMLGNAIDAFVIGLVPCLIGVYFCQHMRLRSGVVRAGLVAGVALAFCAFLANAINEPDFHRLIATVWRQMVAAMLMGTFCGIVAVGAVSALENIFRYTTDITLLELTDYNHPLLRRLQLVAPGTYHHSLMVANLAERAAVDIGVNPLMCRACALFHDIGKIAKPEYFTENQSDGNNPHTDRNPSMSALVIKSHVKEGLEFAKIAGLPKVVTDVIRQHHGTSLIQYFYHKAVQQANANHPNECTVDETTFRYEGPKPKFKESAVVFFADAVEAASRSLSKVTSQTVDDLIERLFQDRLNDHQLDDCPLTLQEMALIKRSFSCTLLNMFHTRVSYPSAHEIDDSQPMLLKV